MTRCQCCDGECAYCNAMGYTWPKVKRMKGSSDSALCRHMLLHPCCKKPKTGIVIHPSTRRPLIFEALPYDIQGELIILYGDNLPMIHPFPRSIASLLEQLPVINELPAIQNINLNDDDDAFVVDGMGAMFPEQEEQQGYDVNYELHLNDAFIDEPPVIQPIVSREELNHLRAQVTECAILQQNVQELNFQKQALVDSQLETERYLDQSRLSLHTQTRENVVLV